MQDFSYTAVIAGGRGPDVWDTHIKVAAPNFLAAAILACEKAKTMGSDCDVVSLEQDD